MRKTRYTGWYIKSLACVMAAVTGLMPPCVVMAAQQEAAADESSETGNAADGVSETGNAADGVSETGNTAGGVSETGNDADEAGETGNDADEAGETGNAADASSEVDGAAVSGNGDTAEGGSGDSEAAYITVFEALPEEETYYPCMYKPSLEEVLSVFPTSLFVWLDGEETAVELEVVWECEEDFENTQYSSYIFYPKWDETQYVIADAAADYVEVPSIVVEVPSDGGGIKDVEAANSSLQDILQKKSILALVYLCDEYEVKQGASTDSETVHTVVSGQSVQITGVEADADGNGNVWYQVLLYQNGSEYTGYVEKDFLATSDEDFADWEDTFLDVSMAPMTMTVSEGCPDVDQFPASYQNALYALKEKHPGWTFVRMDTGLDWSSVIANELGDKSLVPTSSSGSWQNGIYGQGWSYASEGILKYYMDPRNFLNDPSIFQFEQLTYNGSYHTTDAVQEILKNSFMSSSIPGENRTYAQAFTSIGTDLGISPFHLASRVLQEQGTKGTSSLISGSYPGYEGYYNYFNVGAAGKTDYLVVTSGLKTAVSYGWNTRYKALYGGSSIIGSNYILKGQDTLYLEKFNVSNGRYANFTHQYMQNIQAPNSEASGIRKAYANAGALENSFVFKIPVFQNMPASACSKPEVTDVITLNKTTVEALQIGKSVTLIPYVNGSKVDHVEDMTFTSSNSAVATVDDKGKITAVSTGTAEIRCSRNKAGTASCTVTVVKADPAVTTPTLSPIVFREGLQLSGITLPDGWKWENGNVMVSVGTFSYPAVYTPDDTDKYNSISKEISFTVTKAIPVCKVPENLQAQTGTVLGDVLLPSGFVWESNAETQLTVAGEYTFYLSYNPNENNYHTVSHIPVILLVTGENREPSGDGDNSGGSISSGSTSDGNTSAGGSSSSGGNTGTSAGSTGSTTSTGSTNTPTSTGSTNTPTSTGSTNTPTSNGSTNTPTSSGSTNTPTSSGSTNAPTSNGSTNTPTSNGSTNTPTSSGSTNAPTSNGSTNTPTSNGSTNTPTSSGSTNAPTSNGSTNTPTSSGSTNTPTSNGSTNTPTSTGSTNTPISNGSTNTPTSNGSTNTPTSNGSTNTPASNGSINTPASSGSTNTPASNGSTNTPISNESTNTAISGGNTSTSSADAGADPNTGGVSGESAPASNGGTPSDNSAAAPAGTAPGGSNPVENPALVTMPSDQGSAAENNGAAAGTGNGSGQNAGASAAVNSAETYAPTAGQPEPSETDRTDATVEDAGEEVFKPSVTVQMDDTTVLTAETLRMAKEQNFNLLLSMGSYAAWSIDIDAVDVEAFTAADMGVAFGTETIPRELIAAILNGNKYIEMTLAHEGPFGFDPVLEVTLSAADCGRYANLFYYDTEAETLEFICDSIISADGVASFHMDHASCYVIIVSDQSMADLLLSEEPENSMIKWIVSGVFVCMVVVVAAYAVFFYRGKKRDGFDEEDAEEDEEDEYDDEEVEPDGETSEEYAEAYDDGERYPEEEDDSGEGEPEKEDAEEEGYLDEDEPDEIEIEEIGDEEEETGLKAKPEKKRGNQTAHSRTAHPGLQMFNLKESMPAAQRVEKSEEEDEEDDWIEDDEWVEPETAGQRPTDRFADDPAEDDWIDDDEWDIGNDWMDDEEWEKKNGGGQL